MKLTQSQQEAVEYRGSNLLVSASAGSGKTEVLARRVVSLIADPEHPCAIDRLLVVTFTRAAAAELRIRIARMLRHEADQTHDAVLRDHLRRQEVLVDTADIGTIDAWCGRIVRAHAAEAGVDGQFSVLGDEDARLLRREVLDELFDWMYTADEPLAQAARDWLRRHSKPGDDFLREFILKLNRFRENLVDVDKWFTRQRCLYTGHEDELRADARQTLTVTLAEECDFQNQQLSKLLETQLGPDLHECLSQFRQALTDWQSRLNGAEDLLLEILGEIGAFKLKKPRGLSDQDQALFDEVQKRWLKRRLQEHWSRDEVENMLDTAPAAAALTTTLLDLEQRYQDMLSSVKRARTVYEFGDVLRIALDLLRAPNGIARRRQQHYEHILVDEYQDTSPVQVELLQLVTRAESGCSNRFMVGDVKQSIYGFRQAEPRLFAKLVRAFADRPQEGVVRYLSDNFRSHPNLLAGLNRLFAMLFDSSLGGTAFDEQERLRARRAEIENVSLDGQPRIELHIFEQGRRSSDSNHADQDMIPLERLQREALVAARTIRDMLNGGVQIPAPGPDEKLELRPLQLADIVILVRSAKQNAAVIAGVLREMGIPCLTSGRDALLDSPEVMDIRNVLTLLANRRQDVPLAAYLRSPMVGLSLTELLHIRAASPKVDFYEAVKHFCDGPDESATKVKTALAQLDRWCTASQEEELPELLRRIYHETGWLLFAQALPGGEHRVALLRALEGFAVDFASTGQHGVAEFDAYLEDLTAAELDPGAAVAAGENVVRIMTIHAAKGLEFPVVFLLNAGGRFNLRRGAEALQCDQATGIGLRFFDYPARTEARAARHQIIARREVARDIEEELRLFYVAATRARERLLVFGHAQAGDWNTTLARFTNQPGPPPLASRLGGRNALEWMMMGVAADGMHEAEGDDVPPLLITTHDAAALTTTLLSDENQPISPPAIEWGPTDDAWVAQGRTLLENPLDKTLAELPAVASVSALKELARHDPQDDTAHVIGADVKELRVPDFIASDKKPDGRAVGIACHRFLEHADLTRLATEEAVRRQIDTLVADGRLSTDGAILIPVADVAWFGTTATGRRLATHATTARREVPFVYACPIGHDDERTIVRGVIDCLLEMKTGLVIIDYKTDRVTNEAALRERVENYSVQMQLYSQAAERIFVQPVTQAILVFLRVRQVVEVLGVSPASSLAQWFGGK